MALDIGDAVRTGVNRTLARNGLLFAAAYFVVGVLNVLVTSSTMRRFAPPEGFGGPMVPMSQPLTGPSLGVSPVVAGVVGLLVAIVSVLLTMAALRTFVTDETETIPERHFTHNAVWAFLNLVMMCNCWMKTLIRSSPVQKA